MLNLKSEIEARLEETGTLSEVQSEPLLSFFFFSWAVAGWQRAEWQLEERSKSLSSHPSVDLPVKLAKKQLWALQYTPHSSNFVPRASTGRIQTHSGSLLGREPVDALVTHETGGLFFFTPPLHYLPHKHAQRNKSTWVTFPTNTNSYFMGFKGRHWKVELKTVFLSGSLSRLSHLPYSEWKKISRWVFLKS